MRATEASDIRGEFAERAQRRGDVALVIADEPTTWISLVAEMERCTDSIAEAGIQAGNIVLLHADYSLRSVAALIVLALNRNIVIPAVTYDEAKDHIIQHHCSYDFKMEDVGQRLSIARGRDAPSSADGHVGAKLAQLRSDGQAGLILLSSGSTGRPKVILHNLSQMVMAKFKKRKGAGVTTITLLLFDHIGGINTLLSALLGGSTCVIPDNRNVEYVAGSIQRHRIRTLPCSPSFLGLMLAANVQQRFDLSCLRLITYGAELMPDNLLARCRAAFPNVRFLQTYGTTETGILRTSSSITDGTYFRIDASVDAYKIIDDELYIKASHRFLGYLTPQNDSDDGWFRTGDIVRTAGDNLIRIVGRKDDMINVGGEKVFPSEIENHLMGIRLVKQCRVYAQPNLILGHKICADVVVDPGIDNGQARRTIYEALASASVDRRKIPAVINVVPSIGTTERLKLDRAKTGMAAPVDGQEGVGSPMGGGD